MKKLSWKVLRRREKRILVGFLLATAVIITGFGYWQWQITRPQPVTKHEPVIIAARQLDESLILEAPGTAEGDLTFLVLGDGEINVCERGTRCARIELEYPVYRLQTVWSRGEVLVLEYFPLGVPGGLRTTFRGMYDIRGRLNQVETGPQPE